MKYIFISVFLIAILSSCSSRKPTDVVNQSIAIETKGIEVQNSIIKCDVMVKNVSLDSSELSDGLTPGKSIGQVQIIKKNKKTKKITLCFTGDKCYRSDILNVDNCHISKTPYYIGDTEDWYIPE